MFFLYMNILPTVGSRREVNVFSHVCFSVCSHGALVVLPDNINERLSCLGSLKDIPSALSRRGMVEHRF